MAIAQFSVRVGSKGKATAHASYILREDKYKPHADKLEKLEAVGHGNMPEWAKDDPRFFWKMSDEQERKNGSTYREHIIALPRELDEQQRLELVNEWIKNEIGDKHPYSFAIHTPKALDGQDQPHCHLMFSERTLDQIERGADQFFKRYNGKDPTKGGAKKANKSATYTGRKTELKELRSRFGNLVNKHLEQTGSKERIDMRNYKERGIAEKDKPINIPMQRLDELKNQRKEIDEMMKEVGDISKILDELKIRVAEQTSAPKPKLKSDWIEQANQRKIQEKEKERQQQIKELKEYKGIFNSAIYQRVEKISNNQLNAMTKIFNDKIAELEQIVQNEKLDEKALNEYQTSKNGIVTIQKVIADRQAQKQAERPQPPQGTGTSPLPKTTAVKLEQPTPQLTTPAPTQAPPQSPKTTAGAKGAGTSRKPNEQAELSNVEQTNIEGMRRVFMAMYANDPTKLEQALATLEQGEQGIKKGEIELTAKLETKKQAEFVAPEPSKEQDREQSKKGIEW